MILSRSFLQTVYVRLFAAILIIFLPLLVIQFSMYTWGRSAVTQELNNSAISNIIYLRDNFQKNIKSINLQLEYLLHNYTIKEFNGNHSYLSNWDYYTEIGKINNLLVLVKNSNPYLKEIKLYLVSSNLLLSSDMKIESIDKMEFEQIVTSFHNQKALMMEDDGNLIVCRMSPSTAYFYKEELPQYFIQAVLSNERIQEHLSSFSQYTNKNVFLLNHNTGYVITNTGCEFSVDSLNESVFLSVTPQDSANTYSFSTSIDKMNYIAVCCYEKNINCSFLQLIPERTLKTIPDRFRLFMVLFNLLAIAFIVGYWIIISKMVKYPVSMLIRGFSLAGDGDFDQRLSTNKLSNEFKILADHFNNMMHRIKSLILANYEQTICLQRAELKQLQAQINPHFLYNSFFFLRHMIGCEDDAQLKAFTTYLGRYFQYITNNHMDIVPLYMEYEHAKNYLTIQMMRFEGRIHTEIENLPDFCRDIMVPRLILQPIFENIMEHGIMKSERDGQVRCSFAKEDSGLFHIIIEDNGEQLSDEVLELLHSNLKIDASLVEISGIINIHKRLQLHFGSECGLCLSRSSLGGLCVDMILKISKNKEGLR